jgi:hypothetical protein
MRDCGHFQLLHPGDIQLVEAVLGFPVVQRGVGRSMTPTL